MDCPRCKIKMETTHTLVVEGGARTMRLECPKCLMSATCMSVVVVMDPQIGQGFRGMAAKLKQSPELLPKIREIILQDQVPHPT